METDQVLELAQEFAALGAEVHRGGDDAALHRIVELAVKHIAGCSAASITVLSPGGGRTITSSDPTAAAADQLQHDLGEGPCLQAAVEGANYLVFDSATETRWPRYAAALIKRTPFRSVLSMQLPAADGAALNLFADTACAFDDHGIDIVILLAAHASNLVALYEAENRATHLETALGTSRQIGTAIGILMAYRKLPQDQAFAMLRIASQHLHRKLRDIAKDVIDTGTLPDLPNRNHKRDDQLTMQL